MFAHKIIENYFARESIGRRECRFRAQNTWARRHIYQTSTIADEVKERWSIMYVRRSTFGFIYADKKSHCVDLMIQFFMRLLQHFWNLPGDDSDDYLAFVQTIVPFQVCTSIYIRFNPIVMKKYEMLFCCGVFSVVFQLNSKPWTLWNALLMFQHEIRALNPEKFESDVIKGI
jgi:hypothetical protein